MDKHEKLKVKKMENRTRNIEIKSIIGKFIYQHECLDNTIRFTVEQAIREGYPLDWADLREANLDWGYFSGGRFNGADFSGCTAQGADFKNCEAERANFRHSLLSLADFRKGKMVDAEFYSSDLSHANMSDTDLENARMAKCSLHDTNLIGANIEGIVCDPEEMNMAITEDTVEYAETF